MSTPRAYYNEIDPFAAAWLRELITAGHIAAGDVDTRSIEDVFPSDLTGYAQHHFFAGIGGWSYALRLAGWPDDRPVWTGSCPCQPFSAAGKRKGFADERHLWPAWYWLIQQYPPNLIFGEQVANALSWFDVVSGNLEGEGYAVGAAIIGAHSVGAPHIRQRLYWLADRDTTGCGEFRGTRLFDAERASQWHDVDGCGALDRVADHGSEGRRQIGTHIERSGKRGESSRMVQRSQHSGIVGVADDSRERLEILGEQQAWEQRPSFERSSVSGVLEFSSSEQVGIPRCAWFDGKPADWVECRDGKRRPVEPGSFPLAHGVPGRVGLLRGYGNAIVPQDAATFIRAFLNAP